MYIQSIIDVVWLCPSRRVFICQSSNSVIDIISLLLLTLLLLLLLCITITFTFTFTFTTTNNFHMIIRMIINTIITALPGSSSVRAYTFITSWTMAPTCRAQIHTLAIAMYSINVNTMCMSCIYIYIYTHICIYIYICIGNLVVVLGNFQAFSF